MIRGCDIMAGNSGPLAARSGVSRLRCGVVAAGLLATVCSVLSVYPHQLAYFNEASGGPENGHRHLLHSNLDWGQSLLDVREWAASDESRRPIFLAYHGDVDPAHIGMTDVRPVRAIERGEALRPGWYLVSHNFLWGSAANARDGQGPPYQIDLDTMAAIRSFPVIGSLGYAIAVVHVPELH